MKKFFLILITILASTLYAKEVDLNTTDFLGIKYGSSKKEVLEQLIKMGINIDTVQSSVPEYDDCSNIGITDFNFSFYSNKIDAINLIFRKNKFVSVNFQFYNVSSVSAYKLMNNLVEKNNYVLNKIKVDINMAGLLFATDKSTFNFLFYNCNNFTIEDFSIQFIVLPS